MGQPVAVTEKPSSKPGIVRFETNRSFTGMGHEHFSSLAEITGHRPTDELARRLLDTGKVDGVHVYANMITVDVKKGYDPSGLKEVIEGLYTYWQPGMVPPSFEDVATEEPAELREDERAEENDERDEDRLDLETTERPGRCSDPG